MASIDPTIPPLFFFIVITIFQILSSASASYSQHHQGRWPSSNSNKSTSTSPPADYACRPIGPCELCPIEELSSSVCQVYHNRRMVHCLYLGSSSPAIVASILREPGTYSAALMTRRTYLSLDLPDYSSSLSTRQEHDQPPEEDSKPHMADVGTGSGGAEFPTWEACERVVSKERVDFYEFVLCNSILAIVSLAIYTIRTKLLINRQYGKLAARIGFNLPP